MGCVYRPRCNAVWSVWYAGFVLGLEAYLVYLGVRRYAAYNELDWPLGTKPTGILIAYAALHVAVIASAPFFIAFACFKTGNLASDNDAFGARTEKTLEIKGSSCCPRKLKSMWTHGPPAAQTLHVATAFCLLLAQQLMVGKLYQEGFLKIEEIWSTELDFIYNSPARLSSVLPMESLGSRGRESFRDGPYSVLQVAPKLLPILANHKLFGISLEFFNYALALFAFAVVYPSVLWKASKWFSFLFSVQLILHAIASIFAYIGFSLLFRLQLTGERLYPYLEGRLAASFLLPNEFCVLGSYLVGMVGMFLASAVLYAYGYTRFCLSWQAQTQARLRNEMRAAHNSGILRRDSELPSRIGCCEGYCPHLMAILLLVLMVGAKILLLYDTMLIFIHDWPQHIALSAVVAEVAYLFSWILLWLGLTCKRRWDFKVAHTAPEILNLLQADWAPSSAWARYRKAVPDPDSALVVFGEDELIVTDDPGRKAAVLRSAHRHGAEPKEDVYWLRPSAAGSPAVERHVAPGSPVQRDPGTSRLLSNRSEYASDYATAQYAAYEPAKPPRQQHVNQLPPSAQMLRRDSDGARETRQNPGGYMRAYGEVDNYEDQQRAQDVANTFGTLPRGGAGKNRRQLLQGSDADFQYGRVGGSRAGSEAAGQPYASIHKAARPSPAPSNYARLAQTEASESVAGSRGSSYANLPAKSSGHYGAPQIRHAPPQARVLNIAYQPQAPASSGGMSSQQSTPLSSRAYVGAAYATQDDFRRVRASPPSQRSQHYTQAATAPRGGPVYADYKGMDNVSGAYRQGNPSRELTPLSNASSTLTRGTLPPSHVHWGGPQPPDTPNSTLTSQASRDRDAATPTLESQSSNSNHNFAPAPVAAVGRGKGWPPPPSSAAHLMAPHNGVYDRNDSANFSLTSSNESDPHHSQYATSIV